MGEAEEQVAIAPPRPSGWFARLRSGSPAPAPIAKEQLEELASVHFETAEVIRETSRNARKAANSFD